MNNAQDAAQPSYYEVLQIPQTTRDIDPSTLRAIYRKLLLEHHPDKSRLNENRPARGSKTTDSYSIDLITNAYQTLCDATKRADYDKQLAREQDVKSEETKTSQHPTFGSFDLEDLHFDGISTWYWSCRCGLDKGYTLTEEDLEREVESGEIYVGCHGCSLFIKVSFGTADLEEGSVTT